MAEFTQERSEYGHADAPSDSSTSNAPSASPGPITPSAPVSSTPIPSSPSISNPSPALSARSTQDTISWRATELLRTSNEAEKLAARATALISAPTLRVRTNALLATPEMRAALVAKLGPVSINEVLLHPDSAEHGLTCRLFGLDAALSDSIAAAREESVTLLARDFARDALVGAALGDEEQFEHIATLLANNPIVYEKLVRCAADKYIAWVAASSRVASAARAEQGFNLVSWAASGATSFVRSRLPSNIPTVTVSWPGQAVSTPLSPHSSKVEGGAGADGSGDGVAEISVEAPDPPPKGDLPADREGIVVEAKLADPSSFGVDQSSPR